MTAGQSNAGTDYPGGSWQAASTRNYAASNRPVSTTIDSIVVHITQSSFASAVSWFKNPRADVSAHYVIRATDGGVAQMVPESAVAWHAGNRQVNAQSIGIEHEGVVTKCAGFTEAMYRSSARVAAYAALRYGIPVDRKHIYGHSDVANPNKPGAGGGADGHTDPGRCWRWPHYLSLMKQAVAASPLRTVNVIVDDSSASAPGWRKNSKLKLRFGASALLASGTEPATYQAELPVSGDYAVYGWWPPGAETAVPLEVETDAGSVALSVDQTSGGRWVYLGAYGLEAGAAPRISVAATGQSRADAFKFQLLRPAADAQYLDESHAFALGAQGLLASADGGITWRSAGPADVAPSRLRSVRFRDALSGVAVALAEPESGAETESTAAALELLKTGDGGATWARVAVPVPADFAAEGPFSLSTPDALNTFVVVPRTDTGAVSVRATLLASSDGGLSWKSRALPAPGAVSFSDPAHGWLRAGAPANALYRTADGGRHWKPVMLPSPPETSVAAIAPGLPSFTDALAGSLSATFIEGASAAALLYATHDGGATWSLLSETKTALPVLGTAVVAAPQAASADWVTALDQGRRMMAVSGEGTVRPAGRSPLAVFGGKGFVSSYYWASPRLVVAVISRCAGLVVCQSALVRSSDGGNSWSLATTLS